MSTPSLSVPRSKPLRLAVLPHSTTLVNVALVVGGVLYMALVAQIASPLSWPPVPITGVPHSGMEIWANSAMNSTPPATRAT